MVQKSVSEQDEPVWRGKVRGALYMGLNKFGSGHAGHCLGKEGRKEVY